MKAATELLRHFWRCPVGDGAKRRRLAEALRSRVDDWARAGATQPFADCSRHALRVGDGLETSRN